MVHHRYSSDLHVLGRVDKFATVGIYTWTILKFLNHTYRVRLTQIQVFLNHVKILP